MSHMNQNKIICFIQPTVQNTTQHIREGQSKKIIELFAWKMITIINDFISILSEYHTHIYGWSICIFLLDLKYFHHIENIFILLDGVN